MGVRAVLAALSAWPIVLLVFLAAGTLPAQTVRIGVFGLFHPARLVVAPLPGGALRVSCGARALPGPGAIELRAVDGGVSCRAGDQSARAPAARIEAEPRGEFVLRVPGRIERRYRGSLHVSAPGSELVPVVELDLEDAVASVLAAEAAPRTPAEALKAMAIASRSYFVSVRQSGGGRHAGFDFCDTTHCQFLRSPPGPTHSASVAARASRGLVLVYRGRIIEAMQSASCGGRTHTLEQIGLRGEGYPYFAVECEWCSRHAGRWETRVPGKAGAHLAERRSETARLELARRFGWAVVPGNDYSVDALSGAYWIRGRGLGHGVGLCQRGAAGMAATGATFQQILAWYLPNTLLTAMKTAP